MSIIWSRIRERARAWYAARSDAFRRAWVGAWVTFTAAVLPVVLGVVLDLQAWVAVGGELPDLETAGRTILAAGIGFVGGVVNYLFRKRWPAPEPLPPPPVPPASADQPSPRSI
jgi:hypothetical protein